ncbi:MAG: hypothetical protein LUD51_07785 [Clostridia bacterium]|nr:hypothetical protein [Clostridia bacterium]
MVSNSAEYMVYYDGIINGTSIYLTTSGSSSDLDAYQEDLMFCSAMREACHRILYAVCNYSAAMNGISSSTKLVSVTPWWQILILVLEIAALVFAVASVAVYVVAIVFSRRKPQDGTDTK